MDALGISQPALPVLPLPVKTATADATAPQTAISLPGAGEDAANFDLDAADKKRLEAVQRAAQDIANIYVVSDKRFTIFKDVTGQYITRFTSLRDGKVTYIPEPDLLKMGSSSAPVVTLKA